MGELKNAWEIAQERATRLGKLTTEEKEQQTRQQHLQIGQVVAKNWIDGFAEPDIVEELNKYSEAERDVIKEAIIRHLLEAIEFKTARDMNRVKKAIAGINSLEPEPKQNIEEIKTLVQEYEAAERKIRLELESDCKESLHQMRISGTAVGDINIEVTPQWQMAQQKLAEVLMPRLNSLRQGIN